MSRTRGSRRSIRHRPNTVGSNHLLSVSKAPPGEGGAGMNLSILGLIDGFAAVLHSGRVFFRVQERAGAARITSIYEPDFRASADIDTPENPRIENLRCWS